MKMKSVSGVIFLVEDLNKSLEFYKTLGFEIRKQNHGISATANLNWFWIELLQKDQVVTEEFKEDTAAFPKGAGLYIHISVDDCNAFYAFILKSGFKPANEPKDYPWGHREFVLRDPDGYKLVFFERK